MACEGVEFGGVLFLLPSLLSTGLLSFRGILDDLSGYYDLDTIVLTLSFLYLCRIKNAEQTKQLSPGEFGKLLGLDRIPETKTLRLKISQITVQKQAQKWSYELACSWVRKEETFFYYIDGHVQVYSGHLASLGKKHISRMKLCLPGMMEFWVNNSEGLPYFVVTGEVNEKMQEMIVTSILPNLLENIAMKVSDQQLDTDPDLPRFTLVFDREISSPKFFEELWKKYRVAILTYRKGVKDKWDSAEFTNHEVEIDTNKVSMKLCQKNTVLNDVNFREIRKLGSGSHQTSIITTNKKISTVEVAVKMFSRWSQENFFKYMRSDYDLDRISHYVTNEIDGNCSVVNPTHSKLNRKLKKVREGIRRKKAKMFTLIQKNIKDDVDQTKSNLAKQCMEKEELVELETQEKELVDLRKNTPHKIKVAEMEEQERYNKLDSESKLFQNVIKMICYRAESSFSLLLANHYKKNANEKRILVKNLIKTKANITPDYANNTLTVSLFSLSNPRENKAVSQVCDTLNDSETKFPNTNLKLIYKLAT